MKNSLLLCIACLALLLGFTSCASVDKMIETGDYDRAIAYAQRHLAGKKNKKTKYVVALETAFARANERDLRAADRLTQNAERQPENWDRIADLYQRIDRRQAALQPLLPVIDREGIKANFRFVRTAGLLNESKENAAAFHYDNAQELLTAARRGDKQAARRAYSALDKTKQYFPGRYRDRNELQELAQELGVVYVRVDLSTDAPVILPSGFVRRLEQISVHDLNNRWQQYHVSPRADLTYDYAVQMRISDIDISPDMVREREYVDSRKIEDGWEYVLDEDGNVAKDTLGNDIKTPRQVLVKAWIIEVEQRKEAIVRATVEIKDLRTQQLIDVQQVSAQAVFENYASTFRGDERALSRDSRRRIGNSPQPFPPDANLLLQAADRLKPVLKEKVARSHDLI